MAKTNPQAVSTARSFFGSLYHETVGRDGHIVMWSKQSNVDVLWKSDIAMSATIAVDRADRLDSYFQPCLHSKVLCVEEADKRIASGEKISRKLTARRGYHESVTVMPGLWADIDTCNGEFKSPEGLPESTEAVVKVLTEMPAPPTYIIDTGGGVHAYWLFDEPWVLESDEDREAARDLNWRWQQGYVRGVLEDKGWTSLDSTYDLARVMRVPGTLNRKYDPPREVTVAHYESSRLYDLDTFETYIPQQIRLAPVPARSNVSMGLESLPEPCGEPEVVSTLRELMPSFEAVWTGRKKYKSQSERDLAIATIMRNHGASTDSTLKALLFNRALNVDGSEPKKKHKRYYERTLAMASERTQFDEVEASVQEIKDQLEERRQDIEDGGQSANDARAELLARVGRAMGLSEGKSIIAIECVNPGGAGKRQYTLSTSHGRVILGGVEGVTDQRKFRNSMTDVFRTQPTSQGKKWAEMVEILLELVEDVDLGRDATEEGQTDAMLKRWVENTTPMSGMYEPKLAKAVEGGLPWINGGYVHVAPAMAFDRILRASPGVKLSLRDFTRRLKNMGAEIVKERSKLPANEEGIRRSYDLWVLPYADLYWLDR